MVFFILQTILTVLAAILFFVLFLRANRQYTERKWKKVWQFFLPTTLAVVTTVYTAVRVAPRLLDCMDLIRGHQVVITAYVKDITFPQTLVLQDQSKLHYSKLETKAEKEKTYQIYSLPRTKFVVRLDLIER